ncbi:hypothetical protein ACFL38_04830 [Candidatus Omnitrophota bacterium]
MKTYARIMGIVVAVVLCLGVFLADAQAGNTARIAVSCRIPALLEMDVEAVDAKIAAAEIQKAEGKNYAQKEDRAITKQLIADSATEGAVTLYSFYER